MAKENKKNQRDAQDFMGAVSEKYYDGNLTQEVLEETTSKLQEAFDKDVKEIACYLGPDGKVIIEWDNIEEYKEHEPEMLVKRGEHQNIYIYDDRK